jgi:hypothetical protein
LTNKALLMRIQWARMSNVDVRASVGLAWGRMHPHADHHATLAGRCGRKRWKQNSSNGAPGAGTALQERLRARHRQPGAPSANRLQVSLTLCSIALTPSAPR